MSDDAERRNGRRLSAAPDDTPGNRATAVRYIIRKSTSDMVKRNSALRRPDGRYAVGPRKPRSAFTDEQHDFDGSVSRKHVADMQLMRVLTGPNGVLQTIAAGRASPQKRHLPAISVPLAAALERWAEAHAPSGLDRIEAVPPTP